MIEHAVTAERRRDVAIVERVRKWDGILTYYVDFRDQQGRRVRELAGTTKKQARDLLTQRLGEVRAGTYVNPKDIDRDRGPTVKEFAKTFLRDHPGQRRSDHYPDMMKHIVAHLGDRHLKEITRSDLDQFRITLLTKKSKRMARPLSSASVVKLLRTIGRVFRMAVRWGVLDVNPAAELEKPSIPKPKTRFLTIEEFEAAEAAAPEWLRPMLRMAVATGMRLKEVTGLQWKDVDRGSSVLYVSQETKTGRRAIPISEAVLAIINGRVRHLKSPFLFLDEKGDDYSSEAARNRISHYAKKAMLDAGIADASFHTLRHTAAAWMVQDGVPLYEVQHVLGHSTPVMTQRYAHLQPEHLRRAVNALDKKLKASDERHAAEKGQK